MPDHSINDNTDGGEVTSGESHATTGKSAWVYVGTGARFQAVLTVDNLSGGTWDAGTDLLTPPTLDWSIEHSDNPTDEAPVVTEAVASSKFTQVTGAPFPNIQSFTFGNLVSKKYVRAVWTLGGPTPVATVSFKVIAV